MRWLLLLIAIPLTATAQRTQSAKKYVKQGIERFSRNDIVGAIAEYDRAIGIDPKNAELHYYWGLAYHAINDVSQASAKWNRVLQLDAGWTATAAQEALKKI